MRGVVVVAVLVAAFAVSAHAEQCGSQAGGATCPNSLCCSRFGFCGPTSNYCGTGCQSQCNGGGGGTPVRVLGGLPPVVGGRPNVVGGAVPVVGGAAPVVVGGVAPVVGGVAPVLGGSQVTLPPVLAGGVSSIISQAVFDRMLLHRNDAACQAKGFYNYGVFVAAANSFPGFATTGGADVRKREVAAFLAQTSHETTGGWPMVPDGPYSWGYCFNQERGAPSNYCTPSSQWPCAPGKKYFGRGPIQISYNYNYGPAGRAIGADLLGNPDLVATDATVSFKTALWFWMTPQSPKPSSHDVITGRWSPSGADQAAGRVHGYGVITNIINGGLECGRGQDGRVADRIGFYKRYCDLLGVSYGDNLDCYNQRPFA